MANEQSLPKKAMHPALKWVLLGCGAVLVLGVLGAALIGYSCYRGLKHVKAEAAKQGISLDTSHGFKGLTYSTIIAMVQGLKPTILLALPVEEHPAALKAFADLSAKSGSFSAKDMEDVSRVLGTYNQSLHPRQGQAGATLDPGAARSLVQGLQTIADRH